tara:strand:- start:154 stop:1311 length:1158 start_codon:yes stop_codon:yes gene_type:complete
LKTKLLFILLIVASFVGSFFLADHLDRNGLYLPKQVTQGLRWVESLFTDVKVLTRLNSETLNNPKKKLEPIIKLLREDEQQYSHVEIGRKPVCKDTSLGKIKYKKVGDIYTWTDKNDVYHVSDKAPEEGAFKLFDYVGEKVFDYFSLDLNTESLPYDFNQKLTLKLNKLFEIYGQLLDRSSLKKVDINLRIYTSKVAFNQIKAQNNMPISDNTPGFYSHATNQAHLLLTNHEATMRTAIHEATHAINRGIIGYSPKWLNEGLAEYSEYIKVNGQVSSVYPNKNWTDNNLMPEQLLSLDTLLAATNNDWNSKLRNKLYATSWAFIYFMMDNQQRKGMLAKIIRSEQQNLCDVTDLQQVEKLIGMPVKGLQRQFNHWTGLKLRVHKI